MTENTQSKYYQSNNNNGKIPARCVESLNRIPTSELYQESLIIKNSVDKVSLNEEKAHGFQRISSFTGNK